MKKFLLLLPVFVLAFFSLHAQVMFSENFEASANSMPAGWHQQNAAYIPTNLGWRFNTTVGGTLAPYVAPHTHYAFVNDLDNNSAMAWNRDTLYTPVIDLSTCTSAFVSFDYWYYGGFVYNPGDYEIGSIAASADGGQTWTTMDTMGCWETSQWRTGLYNISAFAGNPNVMLAFCYDDLANDANGFAVDNVNVYAPINYDAGVVVPGMFYLCKTNNSYSVTGTLRNFGGTTINSVQVKYSVNNGPVQRDVINALNVAPLTNYYFTHSIQWTPAVAGDYAIKIWTDSINGTHADQLHSNDTLTTYCIVIDTIQNKIPLLEEFSQASCDPCMRASPNLDSVLFNNQGRCNALRYHVSYPGVDHINDETQVHDVGPRVNYYGITGVPDARIDGITDVYPGWVSSSDLQAARSQGSPFTITVNASYNSVTHQYSAVANITAHANLPAGLTARAVIAVDTIHYHNDQSNEDPPSVFAPPIGTGSVSDFYYLYTLQYPEAVEDMMPDSNGVSLGAFTAGQTQTLTFTWTKNHPWGSNNNVWPYDSTDVSITVFVQNDGDLHAGWGAPSKYVYQSGSDALTITGIAQNQLQPQISVYPNPFSSQTTFEISSVANAADARLKVFDMLGQEIIFTAFGNDGKVVLNSDNMQNGIYFYEVNEGGKLLGAGKLMVAK